MPYIITNTQGVQVASIDNLTVDTTATSLTLFGRSYKEWGSVLDNNMVRLLENACSPLPPQSTSSSPPLTGQLWYDSSNALLKVYDNTNWNALATQAWVTQFTTMSNGNILGGYATEQWVTSKNYLSANQPLNITGDISGNGTQNIVLTLNPTTVTSGTYNNIVVDAKGRLTYARMISLVDVTTALGFTPITNRLTNTTFFVDGNAATLREVQFDTTASPRWGIANSNEAEGGSNTGSNFNIRRFNDAGTLLDVPLSINRASGLITVNSLNVSMGLTAPTMPIGDNSSNVATTSFIKALNVGYKYSFNTSSPPSTPITLMPGDKLTITIANVANIPLHVATQQGVYRVYVVITNTNSVNVDVTLSPNDVQYTNSFSSWGIESTCLNITAVGAGGPVFTSASVSPYIGAIPNQWVYIGNMPYFWHDTFDGPSQLDCGKGMNASGAWTLEYTISTFTSAKTVKASSGIFGGTSSSFAKWNDITTAWTSLGTIGDNNTNTISGVANPSGVIMSGTVIVERLA